MPRTVALGRVDRDAVVALVDEVAEHAERRPGLVRRRADDRDPPGRPGGLAAIPSSSRTGTGPRPSVEVEVGDRPGALGGPAGAALGARRSRRRRSRPDRQRVEAAEDEARLPARLLDELEPRAGPRASAGTGCRTRPWRAAPRGSSGSPRRTRGTGSASGRGRSRRLARRPPDRGWPPRTGGRAPGRAGSRRRRSRCPRGPSARTSGRACRSGGAPRSRSGRATGRRAGAASASGWRKSAHHEFAAPLTDASWPAFRRSTAVPISSSSVSRSPPASTTAAELADQVVAGAGRVARGRGRGGRPRTPRSRRSPGAASRASGSARTSGSCRPTTVGAGGGPTRGSRAARR